MPYDLDESNQDTMCAQIVLILACSLRSLDLKVLVGVLGQFSALVKVASRAFSWFSQP
ncbi:hypothetical protein NDI38_05920 [Stenomitos frigidus AS-A4]|uniref:Uncharacterized protein n=1 Tax=Stenomitos frigidus AS-A4 TaxID=2933935 RepID=A0ABV0KFJ2_9CYAN